MRHGEIIFSTLLVTLFGSGVQEAYNNVALLFLLLLFLPSLLTGRRETCLCSPCLFSWSYKGDVGPAWSLKVHKEEPRSLCRLPASRRFWNKEVMETCPKPPCMAKLGPSKSPPRNLI